jgi:outer membrane biosynthesis protein TonB
MHASRPPAPTVRTGGRGGLLGSFALHAAIVAATFFSWPHTLKIASESPPVVPVDLVTIGETTNIRAATAPAPEPEAVTPPPPQTPAPQPVEPPPVSEPAPQVSEAEPAPEPVPSSPKPVATPPPPVPKIKPAPAKPEAPKKKFDINNIAALLDKNAKAAPKSTQTANETRRGIGAQNAMTMDLVDALRNQIAQCWSPPVAAPDPARLIVTLDVFLNPDGSVARPPQLSADSASGDSYKRAAADAARRAIYTCAPYKLPADRYQSWREIKVTFDPRQMAGY